ncbi:hypothetical protein [Actinokineospora iranica]|uniref:hypothetical protein n=1 Tax=Actinokineospora iranica TaxID=1271860 RepID=UPI00158700A9|nr:hypothetical protein [Actinokineospora iranica]
MGALTNRAAHYHHLVRGLGAGLSIMLGSSPVSVVVLSGIRAEPGGGDASEVGRAHPE